VRRALQLGYGEGPRLVLCGQPITITGGHCWYFGGEADGIEGVRRKAREMAKLGADFIKVMGTGGGTPGTMPWLPAYSREEIAALVDEAHRLGRTISIHCLCADAIDYAATAGADQIEHANFLIDKATNQRYSPEAAEKLAASGAFVTGTLAVGHYLMRTLEAKERRTPEEQAELDRWQTMAEDNLRHFTLLYRAGVPYVAGTDAGWRFTPFTALPDELELMRTGGMPALEVISSATGRAAKALGIDHEVGAIRSGLAADIIAVRGNPQDDLKTLCSPQLVMKAGRVTVAPVPYP
jgi:imidazolonepropionase-like amidohydrolase